MKKYLFALLSITVILAFGCQQRAVTKKESQMDQQDLASEQRRGEISEQKVASLDEDVSSRYIEETEGMFEDILFDFDKYNVKETYKPVLQSISAWMMKNGNSKLLIEGHCDERGTNEYNLALGDRRSKSVRDYLVSLGVPTDRLDMISYGEERPLCATQNEGCWSKNRRAHFLVVN
jgi:peptidoglycan-associated lipoprotein